MKKICTLVLLLALGQFYAAAQTFEITPFGGYVFPARWNAANGSLYFNGAAQYGGIVSFGANPAMDVEFMYNRIDTKVEADALGYAVDYIPVSQNYYMIGANKNFRVNDIVCPFVGMSVGGVYIAPKESGYYDYWFFAVGIDAGVKVYFNKFIGLRFQAQMLMPVQGGGFYFYYGSGGGSSNVYVTSTMLDFGLNGGLIFRLGQK